MLALLLQVLRLDQIWCRGGGEVSKRALPAIVCQWQAGGTASKASPYSLTHHMRPPPPRSQCYRLRQQQLAALQELLRAESEVVEGTALQVKGG